MTERLREQFSEARKNPAKELGISPEELEKRQKAAVKPHAYVSTDSQRAFEVRSTARAQQIMSQGLEKKQREKRQKELRGSMKVLRRFQVGLSLVSAVFLGWMFVEFLLPQYAAVQDRNRKMKLRYERAQASLAQFEEQQKAAQGATSTVASQSGANEFSGGQEWGTSGGSDEGKTRSIW